MEYLWLCVVLLVLAAILLIYRYVYAHWTQLQRHGLKGPTPLPFFGNNFEISNLGLMKFLETNYKKYGPIFGYYVGVRRMVLVADPEMMKQILVKEFNTFADRQVNVPKVSKYQTQGLLLTRGEEWRTARKILSPTFSSAKMKMMVPLVKKSVNILVDVVGAKVDSEESVEMFRVFGSFTMESILAAAFGREVNIQLGEADELTKAAAGIFTNSRRIVSGSGIVANLLSAFPPLRRIFPFIASFSGISNHWKVLYFTALSLIQARRKEKGQHKDLLQLMIDATGEDDDESSDKQDDSTGCPVHRSSSERKLTDEQIVAHSVSFLLAGYETTANTLAYTSYLLALNPEIQEKLQREIDDYFEEKPDASAYEATQEITYLDHVIQESLRMYPTATRTVRHCSKTTTINGVTFPEGCSVMIPIHILHSEPKYWKDPEKFDPDRFTAEEKAKRPQLAHMPFGFGPRNCIGMRFALLEAKMALIELLKKYTFVRAPDTEVPLQTTLGITMSPKNGIFLKIASRN